MIMYALLSGNMPFFGNDKDEVYDKICSADFNFDKPIWETVSPLAKDLIFGWTK